MSLLLDARKKSQQVLSAPGGDSGHSGIELSLEEHPYTAAKSGSQPVAASPEAASPEATSSENRARNAGKNLFSAKSPAERIFPGNARTGGVNRSLLLALGGTVLLLAAGAGYVWYSVATLPSHSIAVAPLAKPLPATTLPQNNLAPPDVTPQAVSPQVVTPGPSVTARPPRTSRPAARTPLPQARKNNAMQIEQQAEPIDPLLNNAYLAYRSGKFEQAQQLYRQALNLDARNTDALLGLAVIAQHRGSDNEAAHYYSRALMLDPRNAVANAGMSALTTDDNRESRLKNLLNEQQDSSSLHFALGNHYAGQSRWGEASQSYANAYKLEPGNAGLAFNLAVSLDRLGKKDLAAQHYQRALQLDQSHSAGFDRAQIEQRVQELSR